MDEGLVKTLLAMDDVIGDDGLVETLLGERLDTLDDERLLTDETLLLGRLTLLNDDTGAQQASVTT
jgi:hypothetical protein